MDASRVVESGRNATKITSQMMSVRLGRQLLSLVGRSELTQKSLAPVRRVTRGRKSAKSAEVTKFTVEKIARKTTSQKLHEIISSNIENRQRKFDSTKSKNKFWQKYLSFHIFGNSKYRSVDPELKQTEIIRKTKVTLSSPTGSVNLESFLKPIRAQPEAKTVAKVKSFSFISERKLQKIKYLKGFPVVGNTKFLQTQNSHKLDQKKVNFKGRDVQAHSRNNIGEVAKIRNGQDSYLKHALAPNINRQSPFKLDGSNDQKYNNLQSSFNMSERIQTLFNTSERQINHGLVGQLSQKPEKLQIARVVNELLTADARRPPSGVAAFDTKSALIWPGRKPAF